MQRFLSFFILLLSCCFGLSSAQLIGCNVSGECDDGVFVDVADIDNVPECVRFCANTNGCSYWTHRADLKVCFAFLACPAIAPCDGCTSGDYLCPQCLLPGRCDGTLVGPLGGITTPAQCLAACQADTECKWWSHNSADNVCIKTKDCLMINHDCTTCVSGQKDCDLGGSPGNTTTTTTTTTISTTVTATTTTTIFKTSTTTTTTTTTTTGTGLPRFHCSNVTGVGLGEIASRNFPLNYPNNDRCDSVITMSAGRISLTFNEFNTERSYDYVRIYNGPLTTSPLLATLSGTTLPGTYNSTSTQMLVSFTSDGSNVARGFRATFRAV